MAETKPSLQLELQEKNVRPAVGLADGLQGQLQPNETEVGRRSASSGASDGEFDV